MKKTINYTLWVGFVLTTFLLYAFTSSGEFSFILTLACGIQCFGFALVYVTILYTGSSQGLSKNTFICCAQALMSRLLSIMTYEGYLPSDASGDYVYRLFEILSFLFCFLTILKIKTQNEFFKWYYLAPPMFVAAIFIHPGLNSQSLYDIAWTYALYLEAVALLPQIHLFTKREGIIEYHTSNFVITQSLNKIISLVFWFHTYEELNKGFDDTTISVAPFLSGYCVLGAQVLSILMTADFVIKYLQSWQKGIPLVMLPH